MKFSNFILIAASATLLAVSGMTADAKAKKSKTIPAEVSMSKQVLQDKIRGAWAGQVIGCTYGGPTEFKYSDRKSVV